MFSKVALVLGTRPEAIKMAPLIRELRQQSSMEISVINTGQHQRLAEEALSVFKLKSEVDLQVMTSNQGLDELMSRLIEGLSRCFKNATPDFVFAQGDTASCLAATICAYHSKIPVGHIEAGLRSNDLRAPWPEEGYRQLVSRLASLHFAPTSRAQKALEHEGIAPSRVSMVGNTVVDALHWIQSSQNLEKRASTLLSELGLKTSSPFALFTCHRRENFGEPIKSIFEAIAELSNSEKLPIVFPVHPNPSVKETASRAFRASPLVYQIPACSYLDLLALLGSCYFVLSDSGGIQEEAPSFKKPLLVLREKTERQEGVEAGVSKLVGHNGNLILQEARRLLVDESYYQSMLARENPYGDGMASAKIVERLLDEFKL